MERAALFVLAGHKGNGVAVAALAHAVQQGFVPVSYTHLRSLWKTARCFRRIISMKIKS